MSKSPPARDLRDPASLPGLLRKLGLKICPEWPSQPHVFGSPAETRDILEHAAAELENMRERLNALENAGVAPPTREPQERTGMSAWSNKAIEDAAEALCKAEAEDWELVDRRFYRRMGRAAILATIDALSSHKYFQDRISQVGFRSARSDVEAASREGEASV